MADNTSFSNKNSEGYLDLTAYNAIRDADRWRISVDDYKALQKKSQNKYRNVITDGFSSKKERDRFKELCLLEQAGIISDLRTQAAFELIPIQYGTDGRMLERECKYVADFVYTKNGELVVEDVKSPATRKNSEYIIKRKLMLERHGIRVQEV